MKSDVNPYKKIYDKEMGNAARLLVYALVIVLVALAAILVLTALEGRLPLYMEEFRVHSTGLAFLHLPCKPFLRPLTTGRRGTGLLPTTRKLAAHLVAV